MAMRHPSGKGRGRTSTYFASTHDVGPTVLSVLGVEEPRGMNGADLSPLFDGKPPARKRSYRTSRYNTYVSASDGRWLLIAGDHLEELRLYDTKRDRYERRNIAHSHPKTVKRLWGKILQDAGGRLPHFPNVGREG
jgi:arylsulfatase A-like enzyme